MEEQVLFASRLDETESLVRQFLIVPSAISTFPCSLLVWTLLAYDCGLVRVHWTKCTPSRCHYASGLPTPVHEPTTKFQMIWSHLLRHLPSPPPTVGEEADRTGTEKDGGWTVKGRNWGRTPRLLEYSIRWRRWIDFRQA